MNNNYDIEEMIRQAGEKTADLPDPRCQLTCSVSKIPPGVR